MIKGKKRLARIAAYLKSPGLSKIPNSASGATKLLEWVRDLTAPAQATVNMSGIAAEADKAVSKLAEDMKAFKTDMIQRWNEHQQAQNEATAVVPTETDRQLKPSWRSVRRQTYTMQNNSGRLHRYIFITKAPDEERSNGIMSVFRSGSTVFGGDESEPWWTDYAMPWLSIALDASTENIAAPEQCAVHLQVRAIDAAFILLGVAWPQVSSRETTPEPWRWQGSDLAGVQLQMVTTLADQIAVITVSDTLRPFQSDEHLPLSTWNRVLNGQLWLPPVLSLGMHKLEGELRATTDNICENSCQVLLSTNTGLVSLEVRFVTSAVWLVELPAVQEVVEAEGDADISETVEEQAMDADATTVDDADTAAQTKTHESALITLMVEGDRSASPVDGDPKAAGGIAETASAPVQEGMPDGDNVLKEAPQEPRIVEQIEHTVHTASRSAPVLTVWRLCCSDLPVPSDEDLTAAYPTNSDWIHDGSSSIHGRGWDREGLVSCAPPQLPPGYTLSRAATDTLLEDLEQDSHRIFLEAERAAMVQRLLGRMRLISPASVRVTPTEAPKRRKRKRRVKPAPSSQDDEATDAGWTVELNRLVCCESASVSKLPLKIQVHAEDDGLLVIARHDTPGPRHTNESDALESIGTRRAIREWRLHIRDDRLQLILLSAIQRRSALPIDIAIGFDAAHDPHATQQQGLSTQELTERLLDPRRIKDLCHVLIGQLAFFSSNDDTLVENAGAFIGLGRKVKLGTILDRPPILVPVQVCTQGDDEGVTIGSVEIDEFTTLSDLRWTLQQEMDPMTLPDAYRFEFQGTPCARRQEMKRRAFDCRDYPPVFEPTRTKMRATSHSTDDVKIPTPVAQSPRASSPGAESQVTAATSTASPSNALASLRKNILTGGGKTTKAAAELDSNALQLDWSIVLLPVPRLSLMFDEISQRQAKQRRKNKKLKSKKGTKGKKNKKGKGGKSKAKGKEAVTKEQETVSPSSSIGGLWESLDSIQTHTASEWGSVAGADSVHGSLDSDVDSVVDEFSHLPASEAMTKRIWRDMELEDMTTVFRSGCYVREGSRSVAYTTADMRGKLRPGARMLLGMNEVAVVKTLYSSIEFTPEYMDAYTDRELKLGTLDRSIRGDTALRERERERRLRQYDPNQVVTCKGFAMRLQRAMGTLGRYRLSPDPDAIVDSVATDFPVSMLFQEICAWDPPVPSLTRPRFARFAISVPELLGEFVTPEEIDAVFAACSEMLPVAASVPPNTSPSAPSLPRTRSRRTMQKSVSFRIDQNKAQSSQVYSTERGMTAALFAKRALPMLAELRYPMLTAHGSWTEFLTKHLIAWVPYQDIRYGEALRLALLAEAQNHFAAVRIQGMVRSKFARGVAADRRYRACIIQGLGRQYFARQLVYAKRAERQAYEWDNMAFEDKFMADLVIQEAKERERAYQQWLVETAEARSTMAEEEQWMRLHLVYLEEVAREAQAHVALAAEERHMIQHIDAEELRHKLELRMAKRKAKAVAKSQRLVHFARKVNGAIAIIDVSRAGPKDLLVKAFLPHDCSNFSKVVAMADTASILGRQAVLAGQPVPASYSSVSVVSKKAALAVASQLFYQRSGKRGRLKLSRRGERAPGRVLLKQAQRLAAVDVYGDAGGRLAVLTRATRVDPTRWSPTASKSALQRGTTATYVMTVTDVGSALNIRAYDAANCRALLYQIPLSTLEGLFAQVTGDPVPLLFADYRVQLAHWLLQHMTVTNNFTRQISPLAQYSQARGQPMLQFLLTEGFMKFKDDAAVSIQCMLRQRFARTRLRGKMLAAFEIHYDNWSKVDYYLNRVSGTSTYVLPAILEGCTIQRAPDGWQNMYDEHGQVYYYHARRGAYAYISEADAAAKMQRMWRKKQAEVSIRCLSDRTSL